LVAKFQKLTATMPHDHDASAIMQCVCHGAIMPHNCNVTTAMPHSCNATATTPHDCKASAVMLHDYDVSAVTPHDYSMSTVMPHDHNATAASVSAIYSIVLQHCVIGGIGNL
jgi:hypothetical protein